MKTTTETTVQRGFGPLPCPKCGESGKVSLDLDDLTGDESCQCRECDEVFPLSLIREIAAKWARVLTWIDSAPEIS